MIGPTNCSSPPMGPTSCTRSVAPQGFLATRQTDLALRINEFGVAVNGGIYVSSVVGSDAYSGNDWSTAKATFISAADIPSWGNLFNTRPGWNFYIDSAHYEFPPVTNNVSIFVVGTRGQPSKIYSVTRDANLPPTTLTPGAEISFHPNGSFSYTYEGYIEVDGVVFSNDPNSSSSTGIQLASNAYPGVIQRYKDCDFVMLATGASANLTIGGASGNSMGNQIFWQNCDIAFGSTSTTGITCQQANFVWNGGVILSASNFIATLMLAGVNSRYRNISVSGVDLSGLQTNLNLVADSAGAPGRIVFRDCKLTDSWTGNLISVTGGGSNDLEVLLDNCDSGNTNYRLWRENAIIGSVKSETVIVKTGGASDGVTPMSWKLFNKSGLGADVAYTPERAVWNESIGASKTVTVEIVHDSQGSGTGGRFTTGEVWLEVLSLNDATRPLGTWTNDGWANPLVAAADQDDSSVSWTTTGLGAPLKQKLVVSITPQKIGHIIYRVALRATGKTCYVDALATVA